MKDHFLLLAPKPEALDDPDVFALIRPRRIGREEYPVSAVSPDDIKAFVGIKLQHRGGVHVYGQSAEPLKNLVGSLIAAQMGEDEPMAEPAPETEEEDFDGFEAKE